jgi:glyceraldehyde-3-phosphate dehydrogenase (NADP+)
VLNIVYGRGPWSGFSYNGGKVTVLALIGVTVSQSAIALQDPSAKKDSIDFGLEAKKSWLFTPDADLDLAIQECIAGTLSFNGQRCTALKALRSWK